MAKTLQGLNILVTRPAVLAVDLCKKISLLGGNPHLVPTLEIYPTQAKAALNHQIDILDQYHTVIFISRNAVRFSLSALKARWPILPDINWMAVGLGTVHELKGQGIPNIISPPVPPFNSEALLAQLNLQDLHHKSFLIFRGNGGRTFITDTLIAHGAHVQGVEAYERRIPDASSAFGGMTCSMSDLDLLITTSQAGLQNLLVLIKEAKYKISKTLPLIVVGNRMQAYAKDCGFKGIIVAKGADDVSLIEALIGYAKQLALN